MYFSFSVPTPVEAVEVTLRFPGHFVTEDIQRFTKASKDMLTEIGADIKDDVVVEIDRDAVILSFEIIGSNKVDVAFHLEELARTRSFVLLGFTPDATTSRFIHRPSPPSQIASKLLALEQHEMFKDVEALHRYQALTVAVAAIGAFVLGTFFILLIFYRRKLQTNALKCRPVDQRFLAYNKQPVYVISGLEKGETDLDKYRQELIVEA